jgi:6-phosphogluconolactonase (cycloisomerase 2 family)
VPDLETDHVWVHAIRDDKLSDAAWGWQAPPGSGSRLALFTPHGQLLH